MRAFLFILILFILSACSPTKRLSKMQTKYPYLFKNMTQDTTLIDTIYVTSPKTSIDTSFATVNLSDTVYIDSNNLSVTIYNDTTINRTYVQAVCDTIRDTIVKTNKITYTKYKPRPIPKQNGPKWWLITAIVCVCVIIYLILRRFL